jgi:hypothetical protein
LLWVEFYDHRPDGLFGWGSGLGGPSSTAGSPWAIPRGDLSQAPAL